MKYITENLITFCINLLFENALDTIRSAITKHSGLKLLNIKDAQWIDPETGNLMLITPVIAGGETRGTSITKTPTHRFTQMNLSQEDPSPYHIEGTLPELLDAIASHSGKMWRVD